MFFSIFMFRTLGEISSKIIRKFHEFLMLVHETHKIIHRLNLMIFNFNVIEAENNTAARIFMCLGVKYSWVKISTVPYMLNAHSKLFSLSKTQFAHL